jgi:hypothetical protein
MSPNGVLTLRISLSGYAIKEDEIGGTCRTHEQHGKNIQNFCPKSVKEADHFTDLGVDGGLGKWNELILFGVVRLAGFCGHRNERPDPTNSGEFSMRWVNVSLSRRPLFRIM